LGERKKKQALASKIILAIAGIVAGILACPDRSRYTQGILAVP